jgi:protein-disulfide isomerase
MKNISIILSVLAILISGWSVYKVNKKSMPGASGATQNHVAIVENAFNEKPELVLKAIENVQKRANLKKEEECKEAIQKNKDNLFNNEKDPQAGNLKGDVTVVEFFDYRCGYCRKAYGFLHEAVQKDGNVRIVYKEYPIFGGDPIMAKAALAAHLQGKYEEMHKALMTSEGHLDMEEVLDMAKRLGLDVDKLKKDMKSEQVENQLKENMKLGAQLKVDGTPAFIIGDKLFSGLMSVDDLEEKFKKTRQKD